MLEVARRYSDPDEGKAWPLLVSVFVLSFTLAALGTIADGWPLPRAFDEFSQVLAADTFAHGRLANAPHPLGKFFDTMHVLQWPSYASKYFPGHGLFLASGIVLGGGARLGQWLAFATMGASLCWMLLAWTSRRAAVVGTLLFVLLVADTNWASGFWGSAIAVSGSALLFGAFRRLTDRPRVADALLLGLGVVFLASTRPFEGLAVSLAPALFFAIWIFRPSLDRGARLLRVAMPCVFVLAAGAGLIGLHNRAVTGDALHAGYAEYESKTPGAPPFVWEKADLPVGRMRVTQKSRIAIDMQAYRELRQHWARTMWSRATTLTLDFYLPHALFAVMLLLAPFAKWDWRLGLVACSALLVGAAIGVSSFYLPHYAGPAIPPLLILYAAGCGVASRLTLGSRRVGRPAVASFLGALGLIGAMRLVTRNEDESAQASAVHWTRKRAAIVAQLAAVPPLRPGGGPARHLVFVRYGEQYRSQNEWVQNGADLTGAEVLWAHDLGVNQNARLIDQARGRTVWLLVVDGHRQVQTKLRHYRAGPKVGDVDMM